MLSNWGRAIARRPKPVLIASGAMLVVSLAMLVRGGPLTTPTIDGIGWTRAQELIEHDLGQPGQASFTLVLHADGVLASDPRFDRALHEQLDGFRADPRVQQVISPVDLPHPYSDAFISADQTHALALIAVKGTLREVGLISEEIRGEFKPGLLKPTFTGYLAFKRDLDRLLEHDLIRAEIFSLPLALLVLIAVFGSIVAATLPVLVGGVAVVGGVAMVTALSHFTDMAQYTINVVSLIGLGVAIDYSLFIVSRVRDERAAGLSNEDAIARGIATAGRAVLFSGLAVFVGLSGLLCFPHSYLSAMGIGGAFVVFLAVLASLTLLPALLAVLGDRIDAGNLSWLHWKPGGDEAFWRGVAAKVMRRPLVVLVPAVLSLVALGTPFFRIDLATADVTVLPAGTEARRGYEELHTYFPLQAATRIQVVALFPTAPGFTPARAGPLFDLSQAIQKLPGVVRVESIVDVDATLDRDDVIAMAQTPEKDLAPSLLFAWKSSVGKRAVLLNVVTNEAPQSNAARALVRAIQRLPAPADGELVLGGQTALDVDVLAFIEQHALQALALVISATLLILFFALGSVLLPIKAVLMNLLSIAASFGALVFVFQEGHGHSLLRFVPALTEPTLPVLLFCAVFGLSMDYEVLLLSRMQEEWQATGDNAQAVAAGMARSGRLISSAAMIMVVVFLAFSTAQVVLMKAMGFGMALAVALDATLVRLLIVPAAMDLMGRWNWWCPKPLAKLFEKRR